MDSKIKVIAPGAREKMVLWMATRGGVAVWRNDNLSNPSAGDMYTPARDPDGELTRSPHWSHPGPARETRMLTAKENEL